MDLFKSEMCHYVSVGGFSCHCCNDFYHKTKKKLNKLARAKLKVKTMKVVKEEISNKE